MSANPREQREIQQVLSDSSSSSKFKYIYLLTSPVTSTLTASSTLQEWQNSPISEETDGHCESDDAIIIRENKDLGEEILEDMRAYTTIVESYNFKTEQLHIDLNAAVMNLHKVKDHVDRKSVV